MEFAGLFSGFGWLAFICLILGLGFVIFEMFHPGIGAPGIIGGILLIAGIIIYSRNLLQALVMLIIILAILGAALAIILQSAAKGHLSRHIVLYDSLDKNDDRTAADDLVYFLGKEGITLTPLRTSGTADFEGVRLDVVSDGDFIPKNTAVRIIKVERHRIVVKSV